MVSRVFLENKGRTQVIPHIQQMVLLPVGTPKNSLEGICGKDGEENAVVEWDV